jgi:hypothetical protein
MWRNDIWREILYMEDDSRKRICGTCGEECNMRIMWYGTDDRRKRICGEEHRGSQLYFHITRYVLKRRREDTFLGAKSESRVSAPFFSSKTV